MSKITTRSVDPSNLCDFIALFEARGGPSYCWCMVWRDKGKAAKAAYGDQPKGAICARVQAGIPIGLLAYQDARPIGWVSVGPLDIFRKMGGPAVPDGKMVYSVNCFYVPRAHRETGLGTVLLKAAIQHARDMGADILEAYPVKPDSPSYLFMGFVPAFERQGFQHIGPAGSRRNVMHLAL